MEWTPGRGSVRVLAVGGPALLTARVRPVMRAARIGPLLACAVLLLLVGCATQSPLGEAEVLPARVFRVEGAARWRSHADQPWQEMKAGTRLPPGAVIQIAAKSHADICLGRSAKRTRRVEIQHASELSVGHETLYDNVIRLWENSHVRFDRLALARSESETRPAEEVLLDLSAGHMVGSVPKLAEGSRYEIKFPAGVARVLGAVYDISVEGLIKVRNGSVSVTYLDSQKPQIVLSNQQFDVRTGVLNTIPEADY